MDVCGCVQMQIVQETQMFDRQHQLAISKSKSPRNEYTHHGTRKSYSGWLQLQELPELTRPCKKVYLFVTMMHHWPKWPTAHMTPDHCIERHRCSRGAALLKKSTATLPALNHQWGSGRVVSPHLKFDPVHKLLGNSSPEATDAGVAPQKGELRQA